MRALLVDDSQSMRDIERSILCEMNFITEEAVNGKNALEILEKDQDFQLIMLDVNMPEMNCLDTLKEIKKQKSLKDIPVIMCTSDSSKASVRDAIKHGAANYVVKPFDKGSFTRKIEQVIH